MKAKLFIIGCSLFASIVQSDSWGAMRWGDPWGPDSAPEASYELNSGLLTIKNVDVAGKHYFVELQNQGLGSQFAFGLSRTVPLDHAEPVLINQSVYDTRKLELNLPHVFAGGQYYQVVMKNDQFLVFRIANILASREKAQTEDQLSIPTEADFIPLEQETDQPGSVEADQTHTTQF